MRALSRPLGLLAGLALGLVTGCLGRAEDLIADANARLLITGAEAGTALSVDVSEEHKELFASGEDPLVVYLQLPPGEHAGRVQSFSAPSRCGAFVILVDDDAVADVASVDLRTAPLCDAEDAGPQDGEDDAGDAPDAGEVADAGTDAGTPEDGGDVEDGGPTLPAVFIHLEERVEVPACPLAVCDEITRVEDDGTIRYVPLLNPMLTGMIPAADLTALASAVLTDEVDLLFAGEDPACAQPRPATTTPVLLERHHIPANEQEDVVETVDVAGCESGPAPALRARLDFLRQLALGL